MTLDDDDIEAIADRVVAKLGQPVDGLVGVREVAQALGMSPGWVYRNADQLGAQRLGEGRKRTLRFDLARTVERTAGLGPTTASRSAVPPARRRGRPPKRSVAAIELIAPRGARRP